MSDIEWEDPDALWRPAPAGASAPPPRIPPPPRASWASPQTERSPDFRPAISPDPPTEVPQTAVLASVPTATGAAESAERDHARPGGADVADAVEDVRWRAVAGLGIGLSWLGWAVASLWSTWKQFDPGNFGGVSEDRLPTAERVSQFLLSVGVNVFGILGGIGAAAIAAYACSSRRRHRFASAVAAVYGVLGAVIFVGAVWAGVQSRHEANEIDRFGGGIGPTRLLIFGGLASGATMLALAYLVITHRRADLDVYTNDDDEESLLD